MRATTYRRAGSFKTAPFARIALDHRARHLRRRLLSLETGDDILVDLPQAIPLADGDALQLEDGRLVAISAAPEDLYEVTAPSQRALAELAWHLGNRHLPAQIDTDRILIARDRVMRQMLVGLGATIAEIRAPFTPLHGAYHGHSHD